jgi:hypothetical protein
MTAVPGCGVFGLVQPCRHSLSPELRRQWWAHLCGLCLGLRDGHGQSARAATNVDAVALSVLVEAQRSDAVATRQAGPCPLRGFRPATVVRPDDAGVRHAVAVSLTMAATKIDDHVADGDGWIARVPWAPTAVAGRWSRAGDRAAAATGLDAGGLREAVAESGRRERRSGLSFDDYVAPTEEAAAQACRHTATLAGRPGNTAALDELGRAFGRTVYLVDAVRDLDEDLAGGHFNPLVASVADPHRRLDVAADLLAAAHRRLVVAFDQLDLTRPALARVLFVDQVRKAGEQALRAAGRPGRHTCHRPVTGSAPPTASGGHPLGLVAGAAVVAMGPGDSWVQRVLGPPETDDPGKKDGFCARHCDCCDCSDCCCECDCCDCDCCCCCDC